MNKPFAVGIDLGTSTSEIAVFVEGKSYCIQHLFNGEKNPIVPSFVAINQNGERLVGEEARPFADIPGVGVREIKREMGTGKKTVLGGIEFRPEEISAFILRYLVDSAEKILKQPITEVVITVPAFWPDAAKSATKVAAEIAGLNVIRLINEPTAAALAFGINNLAVEEQLLVFDFGGGTLDITILEMMNGVIDVIASTGDPKLGGKDIDEAVKKMLMEKFQAENRGAVISPNAELQLKAAAEKAKRDLTEKTESKTLITNFASKKGLVIDLDVQLTRKEFEDYIEPLLKRARDCLTKALKISKVRPSALKKIILVGGTTYIPCVRNLVREFFGKDPRFEVNPDLAVSLGAAVQCALAKGMIPSGIIIQDVAPMGLGIEIFQTDSHGIGVLEYSELMAPNKKIPYTVTKGYSLLTPTQNALEIKVFQDPHGTARLISDAIYTGKGGEITGIPPSRTAEPHLIEVAFSMDLNGTVQIHVCIPATNQELFIEFESNELRMTNKEITEAKDKFQELWDLPVHSSPNQDSKSAPSKDATAKGGVDPANWKSNPAARRWEPMITKASELSGSLSPPKKKELDSQVDALCLALAKKDDIQTEAQGDKLADLLFELGNDL